MRKWEIVGVRALKMNKYHGLGIQNVKVPPGLEQVLLECHWCNKLIWLVDRLTHNIVEINYAYMFKKSLDRMLDLYLNEWQINNWLLFLRTLCFTCKFPNKKRKVFQMCHHTSS